MHTFSLLALKSNSHHDTLTLHTCTHFIFESLKRDFFRFLIVGRTRREVNKVFFNSFNDIFNLLSVMKTVNRKTVLMEKMKTMEATQSGSCLG